MGYTGKNDKKLLGHVYNFPNKCLENKNWVKIIFEQKPFCNFKWRFPAENYYNLHDDTLLLSDHEQFFSNILFQSFMIFCCKI